MSIDGPDNRSEYEMLLGRIFDGGGSQEDRLRLAAILAEREELRNEYIAAMRLHASLYWHCMPGTPLSVDELQRHSAVEATVQQEAPSVSTSELTAAIHSSHTPIRRTGILGFLSRLGNRAKIFSALAALLLTAVGIMWLAHQHSGTQDADKIASVSPHSDRLPKTSGAVARLVRTYACTWANPQESPADGDCLLAGQELSLRSGITEIAFSSGARVILQGPAQFRLDSPLSATLTAGKITATVEEAAAKGFTIHSPGMEAIDLGTEFGLEVSPNGLEQVHVFRGEVNVTASPAKGPPATAQRLLANQGIEVNLNTKGAKLVANNGERFARSVDEAQKNRHVVAYWRFEDHPVGVLVPESQKGNAPVRGSLDSSLNGNDLYTWSEKTQPQFSDNVPAGEIPQTGDANGASLDNSVPPGAGVWTRDLFTMSQWSQPSGTDLQTITPAAWTIEASVKPAKPGKTFQTFVARDGLNASATNSKLTPLGLYVTPNKHFEVRYCDVDRRSHTATAKSLEVRENHWYHVAVTSDGAKLKLFVDSLDGKGYIQQAVTALPSAGSTALGRGEFPKDDPLVGYPFIWAVGRGYYGGRVGNWFQGWIDEVRICEVALEPSEFLFAKREAVMPIAAAEEEQETQSAEE
jgi:hypothetical protein